MMEDGAGSPRTEAERVAWRVDAGRRLVLIACRGAVSDADLLSRVPRIWESCPEVIGYDTVVDARELTSAGGWTWPALRDIARQWQAFAQGRDHGRRTAIVTEDTWIARLSGALSVDYQGRRFQCFVDTDAALDWIGRP